MENGSIAEARAKSFLIDRFWILERSVDVDGADLIIQRRLTSKTLLDREPARLGVVQVKFFSDAGTTQYVHREYVMDSDGKPRGEFFLICHTGFEGNTRSFFLTAEDIANEDEFVVAAPGHSREGKYKIPGSRLLAATSKFEIVAPQLVLDRIERALKKADFAANRRFLSWALPDTQEADIDSKYMEPIDTDWDRKIPSEVQALKREATEGLFALEDVYKKLVSIIESTNPVEILSIAEEVDAECGGPGRDKNSVRFPSLWNEDLWRAVQRHEEMHDALREAGLLDRFVLLREQLIEFACSKIAPLMRLPSETAHIIDVKYDPASFKLHDMVSTICTMSELDGQPNTTRDYAGRWPEDGVLFSEPGMVRIYWRPGGWAYSGTVVNGRWVQRAEGAAINWREVLEGTAPKRVLMDEVFRHRFG